MIYLKDIRLFNYPKPILTWTKLQEKFKFAIENDLNNQAVFYGDLIIEIYEDRS